MANINNNAYALTVLSPIKRGHLGEIAYSDEIRRRLQDWDIDENSPMASVPQTYMCRYFVLDDVYSQSLQARDFVDTAYDFLSVFSDGFRRAALPREDHLKSKYLVFCNNFHGALENYLRGMWNAIGAEIRSIWEYCHAFEHVHDADSFIAYIKKCQLDASLFFIGSNDQPLEEQLKALYLKQEFSKFAVEHQGLPALELQRAFGEFITRVELANLAGPSWIPGQSILHD